MTAWQALNPYLAGKYENLPKSRYISLFLMRTTRSEAIFRTEGSSEGCNKEIISGPDGKTVTKAVISKRKQVAVERREGRQILRKFGLLSRNGDATCMLNTNNPCERCIDCMLYGFAVGTGGAQKSRVMSDDAFSILPFEEISQKKTFNALFENNTMRNPETGEASHSIGQDEYIVPGAHFLDIEVLRDVTEKEMIYVLGNIMRSKRYGAITSRIGSVSNEIVAAIGSDAELFSTLEWVTETGSQLGKDHPLADDSVITAALGAITPLLGNVCGKYYQLKEEELKGLTNEVKRIYSNDDELEKMLKEITNNYPANE
jgi:CRISPR-associated protein Csc2